MPLPENKSKLKNFKKIVLWLFFITLMVLVTAIVFIRETRMIDKMIYQSANFKPYGKFESKYNYEESYVPLDDGVKIHTVLFKPDTGKPVATIFYFLGKGENLINAQGSLQPFLDRGFQVFSFEYRGIGLSTGNSINSQTLKNDALFLFDNTLKNKSIKNTPIIIWGRSMGSAFATLVASKNEKIIKGLILEGGFSSFPDIAKHYAEFIHMGNFKWLIPVLMQNDFPAEERIKSIHKPIIIIHSVDDKAVPFSLSKKLYNASNKETTSFWVIKGRHVEGIKLYEKDYLQKFQNMLN